MKVKWTDQIKKLIIFIRCNFDELAIITSLSNIALDNHFILNTNDFIALEAFRRFKPDLAHANISQIGSYLKSLDWEQLESVANYVKGITHELIYAEMIKNSDGGLNTTILCDTSHPDTDIFSHHNDIHGTWGGQLKATDNKSDGISTFLNQTHCSLLKYPFGRA